jgi:hypothetical protein
MYSGTLIDELMATVERAEIRAPRREYAKEEKKEFPRFFQIQIPQMQGESVYAGAA